MIKIWGLFSFRVFVYISLMASVSTVVVLISFHPIKKRLVLAEIERLGGKHDTQHIRKQWVKGHGPWTTREVVTDVDLSGTEVTDAGVRQLQDFSYLLTVNLSSTDVTDDALRHLSEMRHLSSVDLNNTNIGNEGLKHLRNVKSLDSLEISDTRVTDAGLLHLNTGRVYWLTIDNQYISPSILERFPKLMAVTYTAIDDAGLKELSKVRTFRSLWLNGCDISDDGLVHIGSMNQLELLSIGGTDITDDGLSDLAQLPNLTVLYLNQTKITDVGLLHLRNFKNLRYLNVTGTLVSEGGIDRLREAIPDCQIIVH